MLLVDLYQKLRIEPARQPAGTKRTKLIDVLAARFAGDWRPNQLLTALSESVAGVTSVYAVLKHRIDNLPAAPSPAPRQQPDRRCNKGPGHEPYSATNCPICVLDAENAETREAATSAPSAETARAAARAIAASCGTGRKIQLTRRPRGLEGKNPTVMGPDPAAFGAIAQQITEARSA